MPQEKIKFSTDGNTWTTIAQPDELGYSFETTYAEDSGRVQTGSATTSAMFTVEAFSVGYTFLSLAEAHAILQIIVPGKPFYMRYLSPYYGSWRTSTFYVGKGDLGWGRINTDEELVEDMKFNVVGVEPVVVSTEEE